MTINKYNILVLLGAGASVFFNKPTTKEFKENLKKKLSKSIENKAGTEEIQKIKMLIGLLQFDPFEDIEFLFQFLTEVKELELGKIIKNNPISEIYLKRRLEIFIDGDKQHHEFLDFVENKVDNLLKILEDEIFITYKINEDFDSNKLENIYLDNLLKFLQKYSNKIIITTTNYDQIIEESIQIDNDRYNLLNGFKHHGQKLLFDNKHFDEIDKNRINVILLKLHG